MTWDRRSRLNVVVGQSMLRILLTFRSILEERSTAGGKLLEGHHLRKRAAKKNSVSL